jgi:hypothetical protein
LIQRFTRELPLHQACRSAKVHLPLLNPLATATTTRAMATIMIVRRSHVDRWPRCMTPRLMGSHNSRIAHSLHHSRSEYVPPAFFPCSLLISHFFFTLAMQFNHSSKKSVSGSRSMIRRKDSNSPLSNSKSATTLGSPGRPSAGAGQPYYSGGEAVNSKEPMARSRSSENIEVGASLLSSLCDPPSLRSPSLLRMKAGDLICIAPLVALTILQLPWALMTTQDLRKI